MKLEVFCAVILEELICVVERKADLRKRRRNRVKKTCEGCSDLAVQFYGYGGHPSQSRHMGYGGCLSYEYSNADSDVSSKTSDDDDDGAKRSRT
jgi:hypothetical protein